MANEVWKEIKGFEGQYEISSLGRVKSLRRIITYSNTSYIKPELMMKVTPSQHGYPAVSLTKNNKAKIHFIHRLIAIAFIPNPDNKCMVNHLNGIKADNRIENLEWCTCKENNIHAIETGLNPMKEYHRNNKHIFCKPVNQLSLDGKFIRKFESGVNASRTLKIPHTSIYKVIKGVRLSAGGFKWSH